MQLLFGDTAAPNTEQTTVQSSGGRASGKVSD